jgi:hypothetical protein
MIHYSVRCGKDHEFDGWYKDSTAFDRLSKRGLIECPTCGDTQIARSLMAPAVATRASLPIPLPAPEPPTAQAPPNQPPPNQAPSNQAPAVQPSGPPMAMTGGPLPDQMRAMLQRMRAEVEKNCDYVGPAFADEARKIHRGESEQRSIYGETTPDQAEALSDEGIEFARIPWVPRADG